jgi:hypothetical protein
MLLDKQRREVRLLPLALSTMIEAGSGATRFQLLGVPPQRLELRFETGQADPDHAFVCARDAPAAYLAGISLGNVRIVHGKSPTLRDQRSCSSTGCRRCGPPERRLDGGLREGRGQRGLVETIVTPDGHVNGRAGATCRAGGSAGSTRH